MGFPVSKNYMDDGGDRWTIGAGGQLVIEGAVTGLTPAQSYFVDPFVTASGDGMSWSQAFKTMAEALAAVETNGKIFFRGDVREECVGSNLVFDVEIIGVGSLHHPDQPSAAYHPGAACWRPPASPTTATPLLKVRGRGWKFKNFMVDAPVDAAAFLLERNALSGTSEYDASHASFINIRGVDGQNFIDDAGGCYNVTVDGCQLKAFTAAAIVNSSTAVANPLNWKIVNNQFPPNVSDFGNVTHIDSPLNCAIIQGNVFGTVRSTGKYVDLTGGNGNVVTDNVLGGVYDTDDYVAGTGDLWYNNRVAVKATVAPDGLTLVVPPAP
jgi:hypothetical protein